MIDPFLTMLILVLVGLGFLYVVAIIYDKYFNLRKQRERDRAIMEDLGDQEMSYNDPYFQRLTQRNRVGENLPTQTCQDCGAGVDPEDRFCSVCGEEVKMF